MFFVCIVPHVVLFPSGITLLYTKICSLMLVNLKLMYICILMDLFFFFEEKESLVSLFKTLPGIDLLDLFTVKSKQ